MNNGAPPGAVGHLVEDSCDRVELPRMLVETAPSLDLAVAVVAQSTGEMRTAAVGLRAGTGFAPYWHSAVRISP